MIVIYTHPEGCCETVFSWDSEKDARNKKLRGRPSFALSSHVFHDPTHLTHFNSTVKGEDREQTLGKVGSTTLFVIHSIKEVNHVETIRIISSRKAIKGEVRAYVNRTRA